MSFGVQPLFRRLQDENLCNGLVMHGSMLWPRYLLFEPLPAYCRLLLVRMEGNSPHSLLLDHFWYDIFYTQNLKSFPQTSEPRNAVGLNARCLEICSESRRKAPSDRPWGTSQSSGAPILGYIYIYSLNSFKGVI